MLGGADNPNGELLSYIIGADTHAGPNHPPINKVICQNEAKGSGGILSPAFHARCSKGGA